jgi:hypothetical protein
MKIKFLLSVLSITLISSISLSQNWAERMQDPHGNFYQIKTEFEQYWSTHDRTEKGKGYKAFKRWENFVERRVYPTGNLSLLQQTAKNFDDFLKAQSNSNGKIIGNGNNMTSSITWTAIGPMGAISGNAGSQLLKAGRINFITIDPTNTVNLWVGAPAGGLWKSTNSGSSWSTNTDNLGVIGCSDLAIDPSNTNIMYLATGDGDAGDTRSIGVLKSTDGGLTWGSTGLTAPVANYFLIRRLIINPSNTSILLAATNSGIYRTTNGGTSWSQVSTSNCYDIEFKPGNPNVVYAGGTSLRVSTNAGASFTQVTNGITTTAGRMAVAVTPNDTSYVYVLCSNNSTNGFLGLYRSTNGASSFSVMSTTPNILDGSTTGNTTGGQGWYDLCIAASPLNKDEIVTGGVNVWKSTNGGSSWALYGHWTGSGGAPFTHADQHDLEYASNGVLFNTNDGTVYLRSATSSSWTEISGTMNISQIYRIGLSALTANKWITGHQDNGTSIWNGTTYSAKLGGDGMDCFYDRTNDNNVFGEYQNGSLQRSSNGGTSWSGITSGLTGTPPWLTPWHQDPSTANTLYVGYSELFVSTNLGSNWTQLTATGGSGTVREFAIAPSNNQVIYVLKSSGVYKTTNAGTSWTNITGTLPVGSASPEFVCIDPGDPTNAWVVFSGYSSGNKIFVTTNGGTSWTNFSGNLPNLPANCCVYEPSSNDRIYIGMDVGIYYRDNLSNNWTLYNTGLPNVPIADLEITPAAPTLLHAATFGRGVWVASLISAPTPVSNFTFAAGNKCAGSSITFTDQSNNSPNAWSWSVTPSSSVIINLNTSQNPSIYFNNAGTYTVSLIANNTNGTGSVINKTISIANPPNLLITSTGQTVCTGGSVTFTATGAVSYTWSHAGGNSPVANFTPSANTVYTLTGSMNSCAGTKTIPVTVIPGSNISISGASSICYGNSAMLLASGAISYTWNTSALSPIISVTPAVTTIYTVSGMTSSNCKSTATKTVVVNPPPTILVSGDSIVCLSQPVSLNASGASTYSWMPGGQTGNPVSLTPGANTTYTCYGVDANGCSNSSSFNVAVAPCVGINSLILEKGKYTIFPNPTKGKLSIKTTSGSSPVSLEVTDALGKIVLEQQLHFNSEKTAEVNISVFPAGTYFIKLHSKEQNSELIKIIKE